MRWERFNTLFVKSPRIYNFKRDQAQLDNYLNSISSNNIDNLKKKFRNNNVDFDLFIDDLDIDLKWQKYIYKVFSKKIEIDEQNISKELENLLRNKSEIEQYRISEIEIENDIMRSDMDYLSGAINKNISELQDILKEMSMLAGLEKPIVEFKGEGPNLEDLEIEFNFDQLNDLIKNNPNNKDEDE